MKPSKLLLHLTCSLIVTATMGQTDSLSLYFNTAKQAFSEGDTSKFYRNIISAYRIHNNHPTILYYSGIAAAMNHKDGEALSFLKKTLHVNANADLSRDEFNSLKHGKEFQALIALKEELLSPQINSDTALTIHSKALHLECIAPGEKETIFYGGSINKRKIIRFDNKGNASDFTSSAQYGLTSVFGIKVDKKHNQLWACASPMQEMENYDSSATSAVFQFDIRTGKLIAKFNPKTRNNHVFGDIALAPDGKVFVSDSHNNVIYVVNEKSGMAEEFLASDAFRNVQGITFSPDGNFLFIGDYLKGIFRVDMKTKVVVHLDEEFDLSTKSVDGLTYYNNSLIAVQNGINPMRVVRYFLNDSNTKLVKYTIIDKAHPAFGEPTIGFVQNDAFYYLANSLWSGYDEHHHFKPENEQDVIILKYALKK